MRLTVYSHVEPRFRISGSLLPVPPHDSAAFTMTSLLLTSTCVNIVVSVNFVKAVEGK